MAMPFDQLLAMMAGQGMAQQAGSVVPLSNYQSPATQMMQAQKMLGNNMATIRQPQAIQTPSSGNVTSYRDFLARKFPLSGGGGKGPQIPMEFWE